MILMKIDGIEGTSNVKDHEGWIQLETLDWSVGRNISMDSGQAKDRTTDLVHAQEIVVTKYMDSTSAKLFEAAGGTEGKAVDIHFLAGAGKEAPTHSEWVLENALISNYAISGSSDTAMETISLNFTKIELSSIEKDTADSAGSPYKVTFNRETGVLE